MNKANIIVVFNYKYKYYYYLGQYFEINYPAQHLAKIMHVAYRFFLILFLDGGDGCKTQLIL